MWKKIHWKKLSRNKRQDNEEWVLIQIIKPSEKSKKQLGFDDEFRYHTWWNKKKGKEARIKHDCMGYIQHKHCIHTDELLKILKQQ